MKKRNMIVCTLLSISLAANLIVPAMASDTAAQSTENTAPRLLDFGWKVSAKAPDGTGGPGGNGGTPPEMPNGEAPSGEAPDGMGGPGGEMGGPGGQESVTYTAVNEVSSGSEEFTGDLESTGTDENVILVSGADASATVKDAAVTRTSEDSDSNNTSSFYGNAAALLATDGTLYVTDSTIDTNSGGGAGAFAYGDGTVYISDTAITTQQGTSGGIHAAGGGTLYAWNLDVDTAGGSSAAVAARRDGADSVDRTGNARLCSHKRGKETEFKRDSDLFFEPRLYGSFKE